MTESRFTSGWLRKYRKRNPDAYVAKMMLPTRAGFPDVFIVQRGRPCLIEVKYCEKPPMRKTSKILKHKITALQWKELCDLYHAGASCHVLIGVKGVGEKLFSLHHSSLSYLNNMTLGEFEKVCNG